MLSVDIKHHVYLLTKHGDCQKGTLISFDDTELFQTLQALNAPQPQLDKYICIDDHLTAVLSLQKGACLKIHTFCIVILVFLSAVSVVFFNFVRQPVAGRHVNNLHQDVPY